ncbi:MAG: YgaP family membrane protein [Bacillota bacterium]
MRNVGRVDQIVRFAVAAVLLGLSWFGVLADYTTGFASATALFLAVSAAVRVCPVLAVLGRSSRGLDLLVAQVPYLAQLHWLKER